MFCSFLFFFLYQVKCFKSSLCFLQNDNNPFYGSFIPLLCSKSKRGGHAHQHHAAKPSDSQRDRVSLIAALLIQHWNQILKPESGAGTDGDREHLTNASFHETRVCFPLKLQRLRSRTLLTSLLTWLELLPPASLWSCKLKNKQIRA